MSDVHSFEEHTLPNDDSHVSPVLNVASTPDTKHSNHPISDEFNNDDWTHEVEEEAEMGGLQCVPDVFAILKETAHLRTVSAPASLGNLKRQRVVANVNKSSQDVVANVNKYSLDVFDDSTFTSLDSVLEMEGNSKNKKNITYADTNRIRKYKIEPSLVKTLNNNKIKLFSSNKRGTSYGLKQENSKPTSSNNIDASTQTEKFTNLVEQEMQTDITAYSLPYYYESLFNDCSSSTVQCNLHSYNGTSNFSELTEEYRYIEGLGEFMFYGDIIIEAPQILEDFSNNIPIQHRDMFHQMFKRIPDIILKVND